MRFTYFFTLGFCLFFLSCGSKGELYEDAICIEHINTIDVANGPQENMTVIIRAGKIIKLVPSQDIPLAKGNDIIDGTGKYLIPGLWDTHVHFAFQENLAPYMFPLFLAYGITSVRDTGGELTFVKKWKDLSLAHPKEAPRVMIAGPLIDGLPNVYDGSDPFHPPLSVGVATVEEAVQMVDYLDSMGVDLIKAYEMLSPEQFKAIVERAHSKNLKVTGHVPLSMDVISASHAGLNSMEHMRNLELSIADNAVALLSNREKLLDQGTNEKGSLLRTMIHQTQRMTAIGRQDETIKKKVLGVLAQNNTWQIPTLALYTNFTKRPFLEASWQQSYQLLPDSIRLAWEVGIERLTEREVTEQNLDYLSWMYQMAGDIHKAGIEIMAGTDCPIGYLTPGFSLHKELEALVEAGLSPMEALKTATLNPAIYFNMEDQLGLIKEGMIADLIVLGKNPLENIRHTQDIKAVVKDGVYYSKEELDNRLKEIDSF